MHEGYWKVWTRIETVLSWKQHDSLLFPKPSSKTGLQCRSCWKLVGRLWHQKLWLFPVVNHFLQMLASMLKVTQLQFRKKHTHISARCHCLATRLPNATLVRVCACLSKSIRCLQPKVGTRLSWANWSKMKKKIYEESLQLAQRSCKIESKRMLIYDTDM